MEHQKKTLRGKNYTSEDKNLFLSLIETKKDVIECKISNRVSLEAKKEAWFDITRKFNATSIEQRSMQQLKTFYENIKRKTKKEVASENKEKYKELLHSGMKSQDEVEGVNLKDLTERARQEKKEIYRTGGGSLNTTLTEADHRILSLLGDNIRPLDNEYDDANIYFANPASLYQEVNLIPTQEVVDPAPSFQDFDPVLAVPSQEVVDPTPQGGSSSLPIRKTQNKKRAIKKRKPNVLCPKDRYYLQKLENAKIERQILKLQLRKLRRDM